MTPEGGLDSLAEKLDKNTTCLSTQARPNLPQDGGGMDLSPSEKQPVLLQAGPLVFCSTPSTVISYFLRPDCVPAQLRYLGIKVESICMSGESPQPIIWNINHREI